MTCFSCVILNLQRINKDEQAASDMTSKRLEISKLEKDIRKLQTDLRSKESEVKKVQEELKEQNWKLQQLSDDCEVKDHKISDLEK